MLDFEEMQGRGVIVTGGASGIGFALAKAFRDFGAKVFLTDVEGERLKARAGHLSAAHEVCDVTNAAQVEEVFKRAWEELGSIDLLCSNAGVISPGPLLEASRDEINWQFDVNVWGVLSTCRVFVDLLRSADREGHILMTGSETSLSNPSYLRGFGSDVYNMTKHSVLSMADVLRRELESDGIGISVLCPGAVATGLMENSSGLRPSGEVVREVAQPRPEGSGAMDLMAERLRQPDEVAAIAVEGLRQGLFVIPTHPHTREDVQERYDEIQRGLRSL